VTSPEDGRIVGRIGARPPGAAAAPVTVVCAGVAVLDYVFAIERPSWGIKTRATAFTAVVGGGATNGAVTVARLGARARLVTPIGGPAGFDPIGDQILAGLARENVDRTHIVRLDKVTSPISSILIDRAGERSIVTYRDPHFSPQPPADPDRIVEGAASVVVDDHYPMFVLPVVKAARRRGIPVVMDIERIRPGSDALRAACSHLVFSADGAREVAGTDKLELALRRIAKQTDAFVAVTNGAEDMLVMQSCEPRHVPAFTVKAVDTLAAGDVFHAAFALALAEKRGNIEALYFASAVAAFKCTRFGGIAGAPTRAELDTFLREHAAA
jgi:sugar/nucleoside kinase (ribokinase family)